MDGAAIIAFFENLIGESIDQDFALDLLNNAKDLIESDRPWRILIKEDSSQTFGSGDDYLTQKSLPSDFFYDYKVVLGDAAGESFTDYDPIPFEYRRRFKDSQRYYIDLVNDKIHICGSVSQTYTIYLYYIYATPDIATGTSPVWPARFHKLIAFLMAELYQSGVDFDQITAKQALAHNKQGVLLYNAMVGWDAKLHLQAMGHSTPLRSSRTARRTDIIKELAG